MSLPVPYACRNGPVGTVEELQMVKGITPELLTEVKGVLTTHGNGAVNINTCGERVLGFLGLPETVVDAVVICRRGADGLRGTDDDVVFETAEDFRRGLEGYLDLTDDDIGRIDEVIRSGLVSVKSSYFRIHSIGLADGGKARKEITAVVMRPDEGLPEVVFWYEG
jgi:hypothetical protein